MASYYWIKLYTEMLDDSKVAQLPDRLWRRFVEMCLFARKHNSQDISGDMLPSLSDMAWTLHLNEDELLLDLQELARLGFMDLVDEEAWRVRNFAKRQSPVSDTERAARFRERQQRERYYGDDESVTNRDSGPNDSFAEQDTDTEQETETDTEQNNTRQDAAVAALECLRDFGMNDPEGVLAETTLTPAQVMETVAYARERDLGPGWVRTQLRANKAHRPRGPTETTKERLLKEAAAGLVQI